MNLTNLISYSLANKPWRETMDQMMITTHQEPTILDSQPMIAPHIDKKPPTDEEQPSLASDDEEQPSLAMVADCSGASCFNASYFPAHATCCVSGYVSANSIIYKIKIDK